MMADADLQRMADDIKENGQNDDIITHEGKILDGRNRFKACGIAGVNPRFTEYYGTEPLAFVISHNLHRRHLNEAQRGMVGAKLANLQKGGESGVHKTNSTIVLLPPVTQKQASEMLNVGVGSIKQSKQVMRTGIPELQDMQMSGEIAAVTAATVAKLPEDEQRKAVSGGVSGVKKAAKKSNESSPQKKNRKSSIPNETDIENENQRIFANLKTNWAIAPRPIREKFLAWVDSTKNMTNA